MISPIIWPTEGAITAAASDAISRLDPALAVGVTAAARRAHRGYGVGIDADLVALLAANAAESREIRIWKRERGKPLYPGAIYVGRPSRWGNPYTVAEYGRAQALEEFRGYALERFLDDPDWLLPLSGRDLACWCAPEPCHADVLAWLANMSTSEAAYHGFVSVTP